MVSATSERTIRARKKQAEADADINRNVITALMSRLDGRRWIWLFLERAQIFVEDGNLEPYRMAYSKGARNEGLRMLNDVTRTCPDEFVKMIRENSRVQLQPEEETNEEAV